MDPFTQRMLERAKARREKLDTQLSNAGHDLKKRRSPLKDANAILAQAPVTVQAQKSSSAPAKSSSPASAKPSTAPTKTSEPAVVRSPVAKQSPVKSPRKTTSPAKSAPQRDNSAVNKENGENAVTSVRSKLHRLGKLYSDDSSRELSSPIHRTEERFTAEDEPMEGRAPVKSKARLDRLAALASTINNWEDDLSHPTVVKPVESKAEKIQAKLNEQVKSGYEPQPGTSGCSKWKSNSNQNQKKNSVGSPTKPLKWDKSVLENLEAQGYTRSKSNSRLVYDYKGCSQGSKTDVGKSAKEVKDSRRLEETRGDKKLTETGPSWKSDSQRNVVVKAQTSSNSPKSPATGASRMNGGGGGGDAGSSRTPEKSTRNVNSGVSNSNRLPPRFGGYNGSPKSPIKSSPGSVLSKASLFESKGTEARAKDPAEMTLSERMALFERNNKGEAPLIPKAPLTMSVPTKKLLEREKSNNSDKSQNQNGDNGKNGPSLKSVNANRAVFEQGFRPQELENDILRTTQIERQRELDMLRSRFNRNKEMAQAAAGSCIRTSESSEVKSNSPKSSPVCPVKPTPALEQVPPAPPLPNSQSVEQKRGMQMKNSPAKRQVVGSPPKSQPRILSEVKRIRVSPPKPGNLYPNLSGIESSETETDTEYTLGTTEPETATCDEQTETETEAEYYVRDEEEDYDSAEESEDMPNTSLERSILRAVNQQAMNKKKRSIDPDPDSTVSDISVLDEMDDYLDECLARQEAENDHGPTPPKLNRAGKSPSSTSTSFKYSHGAVYRSPIKVTSTRSPRKGEQYVVDGDSCMPLMHSVSFYRKQQSQTPKTPVRHVSRTNDMDSDSTSSSTNTDELVEAAMVQEKVKRLQEEVCKQQTIIGQASQALNLCHATVEFTGSREQVEGERLLLVATHRRQAALNEIQRLKVEGTLRPVVPGSSEVQESGSLTISALTLPLKRDYFRNVDADTCLHFLCLVRYLENIVVTPVVQAEPGDSCVRFPSTLKLEDLYSDFKITIEVYTLETRAEVLPHEIKYHIHNNGGCGGSSSGKKGSGKTPKKFLKQESRLVMPSVQSPAGPGAVRTPAFALAGYVVFSLREVNRQQFTLNKVPRNSALEGRLQMHVSSELSVTIEHRGFLTMFEDVSGFGAWHRRWCLLKGAILSYWKYPDDERKKTPIGSLDLQGVTTTNVGLVSRDICARPNTFLLENVRPAQPGDCDSLVLVRNGAQTTIRHLLSADTKEDRLEWCSKLNKTLNLLRAWGGSSSAVS